MRTDDRAISEALGYVLVFGIVISTVAVVYAGGFSALNDARSFERMNNAERAFDVLADNAEDITQRGAPSRATEIKLAQATLRPGNRSGIRLRAQKKGDPDKNFSTQGPFEYDPIVLESNVHEQSGMVYALGATFRRSQGVSTMKEEPPFVLEEHRVIVPVVQTIENDAPYTSGTERVLIEMTLTDVSVLYHNTSVTSTVWINVSSPRAGEWNDYMADTSPASCSQPNSTFVSCKLTDIEVVYFVRYTIEYDFE